MSGDVPTKAALRAEMLKKLRALPAQDRQSLSATICERVLRLEAWQNAKTISLFLPLPSEPDISPLGQQAGASGKEVIVIPSTARLESDVVGSFAPDLILAPGLAFSKDRHRLGRGGGFFDRLLAGRAAGAIKVGVCFSFQLLDAIPAESHDVLMNAVISD